MLCRNCSHHRTSRPRGLCWNCYYTPGVRDRFPSTSKYGQRGHSAAGRATPPPEPTSALPGSPEKVAVLEARARHCHQLWHPKDSRPARDW